MQAAWDLTRNVTYAVNLQRPDASGALGAPETSKVVLDFAGNGDVAVTTSTRAAIKSTMTADGRITPKNPADPYLFWGLVLTQVLPPDGTAAVGETWIVSRPDDSELAGATGLVTQSRMTYTVTQISPELVVSYTGEMRVAPSPGLDALADGYEVPQALANVAATRWQPAFEGSATFSTQDGSATHSEGDVRPFAALGRDSTPLTSHPARIHFSIDRS